MNLTKRCSIPFVLLLLVGTSLIDAHLKWIEAKYPLQGQPSPPGTPWPLPANYITSPFRYQVDSNNFQFTSSNSQTCNIVSEAFQRYRQVTFPCDRFQNERKQSNDQSTPVSFDKGNWLTSLNVEVSNWTDCEYPHPAMDESYELKITDQSGRPEAVILANSVWGALRGLETFSQLVYTTDLIHKQKQCEYFVNSTTITDRPAFSYRGLMLDTSRHYLPVSTLLAHLDAMAFNKFNVFHWHIVDDQSWPLVLDSHPELSTEGAYSYRHVYTKVDIARVVEYARVRGIRVLPELDSPGHTFTLPKRLLTICYAKRTRDIQTFNWTMEDILWQNTTAEDYGPPYTGVYSVHGEYEILNPTKEETFAYVLDLLLEFKNLFPDEYVHLGMDEVYYACWQSNPEVIQFMRDMNFTRLSQVEEYYVSRTLKNVRDKVKRKYQIWQDPFDNGVEIDSDAVIQVWKGKTDDDDPADLNPSWKEYAKQVAAKNYNMVLSTCWYLNYIVYPSPKKDWEKYYDCSPLSFSNNSKEQSLILGGEACVWGEYSDATVSLSRTWPRASAVAERLWSNPTDYDLDFVRFRLDDMRCRLVQRGIPAAPILNGYCGDYEWDMN